jgi:hypothetical protein
MTDKTIPVRGERLTISFLIRIFMPPFLFPFASVSKIFFIFRPSLDSGPLEETKVSKFAKA